MKRRRQEVPDQQNSSIPDQVIEVFNDLIVKEFNGRYAFLRQDAIISALAAKGLEYERLDQLTVDVLLGVR